jgi:hypothetical protein
MHQPRPALPEIGVGLHGNSLNRVTMDGPVESNQVPSLKN